MNGRLRLNPPAELVREILLEKMSGALRLMHGRVKSIVYFNQGEAVYAGSNVRALRLFECVRRWQTVPIEKLRFIEGREVNTDTEFGSLLVTESIVSREEFARLLQRQATEAFCHALGSDHNGEWEFDARVRLTKDTWTAINADKLLIERARRASSDFISARMSDMSEIIAPVNNSLRIELSPTEGFVLSRVDSPLRLGDLIALSGMAEADAKGIIYALALGGCVRRENAGRAFAAHVLAQTEATNGTKASNGTVALSDAANNVDAKPPREAKHVRGSSEDEPRDGQAEIEELFKLATGANHYEVLGVSRSVSPEELKRVYYSLAKRFHPDRFHKDADENSRVRIESAFARIAQGYETLSDRAARATYDLKLAQTESFSAKSSSALPAAPVSFHQEVTNQTSPTVTVSDQTVETPTSEDAPRLSAAERAAENFRRGAQALDKGDDRLATVCLSEAAKLMPSEASYRAQYGRALARNQRTRRLAEAEFLAAIALDKRNITYRVSLAELYRDIGLKRRAEGELERALAVDPQHAHARRLLNELRAA